MEKIIKEYLTSILIQPIDLLEG